MPWVEELEKGERSRGRAVTVFRDATPFLDIPMTDPAGGFLVPGDISQELKVMLKENRIITKEKAMKFIKTGNGNESIDINSVTKFDWFFTLQNDQVLQDGDIHEIEVHGKLSSGDDFNITGAQEVYEFAGAITRENGFEEPKSLLYFARKSLEYEKAVLQNDE